MDFFKFVVNWAIYLLLYHIKGIASIFFYKRPWGKGESANAEVKTVRTKKPTAPGFSYLISIYTIFCVF